MRQQVVLLGAGHRARNGKDTFAEHLQQTNENVYILHWAKPLYDELTNETEFPLITSFENFKDGLKWYMLLDKVVNGEPIYDQYNQNEVPTLHKIFSERKIEIYWGMEEKDAQMLQFWGTEYRRKMYGSDYWVNKGVEAYNRILAKRQDSGDPVWIIFADTRFPNEYEKIKLLTGKYIRVTRINEDGTQYIDPSRDPNHESECSLEGVKGDYEIVAKNVDELKKQADEIVATIKAIISRKRSKRRLKEFYGVEKA